jgi:hypothetical protein
MDASVAKGMVFGSSPTNMGLDVYTSDKGLLRGYLVDDKGELDKL